MSEGKNSKALSILGSVLGASVVLAVLIYKDDELRAEAQNQFSRFLRATRKLLLRYEKMALKSGKSVYTRKIDENNSNIGVSEEGTYDEAYDSAWSLVESKLKS